MRDDPAQDNEASSSLACQRVVQALIKKYDWALLAEAELVNRVWTASQNTGTTLGLEQLAKTQYGLVLYAACQEQHNPARRNRAYEELYRFLLRIASDRWPDVAGLVAQRGLVLVYEQFDRCHGPNTFLGFAFNKLRQAFTEEMRARNKLDVEREILENQQDLKFLPSDQSEILQVLLKVVQQLPDPRQQKTIILKFFEGLSDEAIAAQLHITPGHVRKLRHDGIIRLRQNQELRGYFDV